MPHRLTLACTLAAMLAAAAAAHAQDAGAGDRAALLGHLTHTRLTVLFDNATARDAIEALGRAINVPVRGRFADDRIGHGIDPDIRIDLLVENMTALQVLERIIEQCETYEPVTWQLRRGFIEVGTKERLSAPSAAETRFHQVNDLLLKPIYSEGPAVGILMGGCGVPGGVGPYAGGWISSAHPGGGGAGGAITAQPRSAGGSGFYGHPYASAALSPPATRKSREELTDEIIRGIVEVVEPGNWDYGQYTEVLGSIPGANALAGDKIARIRAYQGALVIHAPDFIHREIEGYPPPIAPGPLTEDQRAERSDKASLAPGVVVDVLAPANADEEEETP